jgi:hypothetical protein
LNAEQPGLDLNTDFTLPKNENSILLPTNQSYWDTQLSENGYALDERSVGNGHFRLEKRGPVECLQKTRDLKIRKKLKQFKEIDKWNV